MLSLLGILVVVVGLAARFNPIVVVTAAAIVTGLAGGLDLVTIVSTFGKAFNDSRYISLVFLVLPVIGLLERYGLQARARTLIGQLRSATVGRLLLAYLFIRQVTAALGLLSLGGHPQMVRPLIAPMAEGAEENLRGPPGDKRRQLIRAFSASADNVGAFFGEDIFIAFGSVLLIQAVLEQNGLIAAPLHISLWAIPTAILAFVVHGVRLLLLDRSLARPDKTSAAPEPDQ
ncbi:MAG: rane protein [Caulobacter sp.]|nr:rane protein [Caulobacter sp.]